MASRLRRRRRPQKNAAFTAPVVALVGFWIALFISIPSDVVHIHGFLAHHTSVYLDAGPQRARRPTSSRLLYLARDLFGENNNNNNNDNNNDNNKKQPRDKAFFNTRNFGFVRRRNVPGRNARRRWKQKFVRGLPQILQSYWRRIGIWLRHWIQQCTVYVLECEGGMYYVGSTQNRRLRYQRHFSHRGGSEVTRKHRPIQIVHEVRRVPRRYLLGVESQITAEWMMRYGVNNVRGSYFCRAKEYTLQDEEALRGFLGHYNALDYRQVEQFLQETLPPSRRGRSKSLSSSSSSITSSSFSGSSWTENRLRNEENDDSTESNNGSKEAGQGARKPRKQRPSRRMPRKDDVCWNCGELGHFAYNCSNRQ